MTSVSPISISSYMSKTDSEYPLRYLKAVFDEKEKPQIVFDPLCIRKKCNWSSVKNEHKFDDISFDPAAFLKDIPSHSPKLHALLKKIAALDARDEKKHGHKFKHFIFSDIKSGGQGAKMLAAGLIAAGWTLGYKSDRVANKDDKSEKPPKWGALELLTELPAYTSFYLLSSATVFDKPISVRMKKEILTRFNARPDNIYGENARIIVMDSGFKEGIDLFDVKYVHIFEPSLNAADQKQVIGRGTRTCGQKGLEFHPIRGWPLEVYLYDLEIPAVLRSTLLGSNTAQELLMRAMNVDVRLSNFTYDIERLAVIGSVDYELNEAVHNFKVELEADEEEIVLGGGHRKFGEKLGDRLQRHHEVFDHKTMLQYVKENYGHYKWENVKMENLCVEKARGGGTIVEYNPTQNFIRSYFTPNVPVKGMLLYHSTGSGKTCSAIAAATANFEPAGYTILWVTRTTLKNDIWKNMFSQVCSENIRNRIAAGEHIPDEQKEQMKLLSKAWRIRPISYKQFSNLVSKKNSYYQRLVKENGEADPLRKTLIIIDEAHKLYGGGDLSSLERPDMDALHQSLMNSYAVSGYDSVRLLLMTATPITENPMELVQLINLCKTVENQIPKTFEVFADTYLNKDGGFSTKGEHTFLDDIAGHISYLNRERDARQFSQPVIKRVMVPIVTDEQMKDVRNFDKFVARSETEARVLELQEKSEKIAENLDGELAELDKSRFQHLKKACEYHEEIPRKKCETIVNRNITALVREVKDHIKTIKDQSKKVKEELRAVKQNNSALKDIQKRILDHPELFSQYKSSTYAALRNACSSKIKTSAQFLEAVKDIPEIQVLNRQIADYKEEIAGIENQLVIQKQAIKNKIKRVKEMLREPYLSELERSVLELTLRTYQKERRRSVKNTDTSAEVNDLQSKIKRTETEKNRVFSSLRKSMKRMTAERKKTEKQAKKELRELRKTMRIQGKMEEAIETGEIKDMVDRREVLIERDLDEVIEEAIQKEIERDRKKMEKEIEREEKAKEKDRAAREKQAEKERAKLEKQEAAKTKKNQEKLAKEAAKAEAKTRKNQEKLALAAAKAQAKEAAKAQTKTRKNKEKQALAAAAKAKKAK